MQKMFAAVTVALVITGSAVAQVQNVALSGLSEVPAVITVATGNAILTYNAATTQLNWNVSWSNLNNGNGNNTSIFAHIHAASGPNLNGPVVIDFGNNLPGVATGSVFLNTLTNARLAALFAGNGYVNVHSSTFQPGELRGNIPAGFIPAPGAAALLGLGALAAGRRRR